MSIEHSHLIWFRRESVFTVFILYFIITGPYQCELCQNITDSKEDFVRHIKTEHWDDVDDDVMITLTTDLKKAKRKSELAAKEAIIGC